MKETVGFLIVATALMLAAGVLVAGGKNLGAGMGFGAEVSLEPPAPEQLAIIVNKSNPIDNLSFGELQKIFLAERRQWPNGKRITVTICEPGQLERTTAMRLIYRMSENDFSRYWLHVSFTGDTQAATKTLTNATGIRKFVSYVPGAIGYVLADRVDDSVKVVRVDGRLPSESGYRLATR